MKVVRQIAKKVSFEFETLLSLLFPNEKPGMILIPIPIILKNKLASK